MSYLQEMKENDEEKEMIVNQEVFIKSQVKKGYLTVMRDKPKPAKANKLS